MIKLKVEGKGEKILVSRNNNFQALNFKMYIKWRQIMKTRKIMGMALVAMCFMDRLRI